MGAQSQTSGQNGPAAMHAPHSAIAMLSIAISMRIMIKTARSAAITRLMRTMMFIPRA
jgi:hypothetical protein